MNYVYTLLLQKRGIKCGNEGVGKRGLREKRRGEDITSIHILIPLFYKDGP